jgi:hypothetical protein
VEFVYVGFCHLVRHFPRLCVFVCEWFIFFHPWECYQSIRKTPILSGPVNLVADDQIITQNTEDKLHKSVYIIKSTEQRLQFQNIHRPQTKQKIMAFKGKQLLRSKIEIDGSVLEQMEKFNYFGCELSLDGESDFDKKKSTYFKEYAALLENT